MKLKFQSNSGQAVLVVVLLTAAIGLMSVITAQRIESRQFSQINRVTNIEKTYYATEGALHETLRHLTSDLAWPSSSNFSDQYTFEGVTIQRTLVRSTESSTGSEVRTLTLEGNFDGITRKVGGEIKFGSSTSRYPADIIMTLDSSYSMQGEPFDDMKTAAKQFVDYLEPIRDRAGLVSYGEGSIKFRELIDVNRSDLNQKIDDMYLHGGTDMTAGLKMANEMLLDPSNQPFDPDTRRAEILLSDGLANRPRFCDPCKSIGWDGMPINDSNRIGPCQKIRPWLHSGRSLSGFATGSGTYNVWDDDIWAADNDDPNSWQENVTINFIRPTSSSGRARYPIRVPASYGTGLYEIYGWVYSVDSANNAYYLNIIDDTGNPIGPPRLWHNNAYAFYRKNNDNVPFLLEAGKNYTLEIRPATGIMELSEFILQPACAKRESLEEAQIAKDNEIVIHSIAFGVHSDHYTLEKIAELTGGQFYYAPTATDLENVFKSIGEAINIGLTYTLNEEVP